MVEGWRSRAVGAVEAARKGQNEEGEGSGEGAADGGRSRFSTLDRAHQRVGKGWAGKCERMGESGHEIALGRRHK